MEINKIYNFNTRAPSILGVSYANMKVIGIMTFQRAVVTDGYADLATQHENIRTLIPNLPTLQDSTFILFEKTTGENEQVLLSTDYIDDTTVVLVSTLTRTLILNDIDSETLTVVKTALKELGVKNFELE